MHDSDSAHVSTLALYTLPVLMKLDVRLDGNHLDVLVGLCHGVDFTNRDELAQDDMSPTALLPSEHENSNTYFVSSLRLRWMKCAFVVH